MNMNCSGHAELRDPDWYDPSRSLDRAKSSPSNTTVETDASSIMHNSLTSLNMDSFMVTEFSDQYQNHFSVRSLPVISSNNTMSMAAAPDAPWNESPRSLRGVGGISNSAQRSSRASKPPPGVSALDHLQNSLSSLAAGANAATSSMTVSGIGVPMHDVVTLEDDSEYESLAGENDDNLYGSFASLRLADVMNTANDNEMDATAHAGNVQRSHSRTKPTTSHNYQHQHYPPASPQRSLNASNRSHNNIQYRNAYNDNNHNSYASGRSATTSPVRSSRNRYLSNAVMGDTPSISTLGEHTEYYTDGFDLGDNDDDDNNIDIINVLRAQIDTLKHELLSQQDQNQKMKQQYEHKNQMSQFLPMDSILNHDSGICSFGQDSFKSLHSNKSNLSSTKEFTKSTLSDLQQKQLSDAEIGIFGSISALKLSLRKQQEVKENRSHKKSSEQQPVSPESDDSANNNDEDFDVAHGNPDISSSLLLDELVICELEAQIKTMQRIHLLQRNALNENQDLLQQKCTEQASKIMELERQLQMKM